MRLHETAQAGHDEHAVLLGFLDRGVSQVLQERCSLLVVQFILLRQQADELRFSQTSSHLLPPRKNQFNTSGRYLIPIACGKHLILRWFLHWDARESAFL